MAKKKVEEPKGTWERRLFSCPKRDCGFDTPIGPAPKKGPDAKPGKCPRCKTQMVIEVRTYQVVFTHSLITPAKAEGEGEPCVESSSPEA